MCTFIVLIEPLGYRANAHFFSGCGPSIVSSCLRREHTNKGSTCVPTNTTEASFSSDFSSKSYSLQSQKNSQNSEKSRLDLRITEIPNYVDRIDYSTSFERPKTEPEKDRKLSPATLSAMLSAELDHYIKVETEIGQVAEIKGNVHVAEHEKRIASEIINEDEEENDEDDLKELEALDAEINRLETILTQKLQQQYEKQHQTNENEYYSDEYYSDEYYDE